MVSLERWQRAQSYERNYWAEQAKQIAAGATQQLGFYKWRANQLTERLQSLGLSDLTAGKSRIIEVGSGPIGVMPSR